MTFDTLLAAMTKTAGDEDLGAALCDGFMARLAQYDAKTASVFDSGLRGAATGSLVGGVTGSSLGAANAYLQDKNPLEGALLGGAGGAALGAGIGGTAGHYTAKGLAHNADYARIQAADVREAFPWYAQAVPLHAIEHETAAANAATRGTAGALGVTGAALGGGLGSLASTGASPEDTLKTAAAIHYAGQQSAANVLVALSRTSS